MRAFKRAIIMSNLMTQAKRDRPPQQESVVDDALNDALIATFPASDPVSIVATLIPGTRDQLSAPTGRESCPTPTGPSTERVANARHQGNLANAVAFLLVLLAVLLMSDARSSYPIDLVAATRTEGIVPVPPM